MFWFAGRLGRDRVCALRKGDVEMPSDFAGVGYIEMDDRGAWKGLVLKELETAGYEVDWKKALYHPSGMTEEEPSGSWSWPADYCSVHPLSRPRVVLAPAGRPKLGS